jgi:hypothetical protein
MWNGKEKSNAIGVGNPADPGGRLDDRQPR